MEWSPAVGGQSDGAAALDQERRVPAHVPVRPDDHGHAEDRGLEHRVQPRAVIPAAHEGDVGERVEVRQDTDAVHDRSEEHTSELQSLAYLVCRLLLEKKKAPTDRNGTPHSRVLYQ